jgi:hypothetical protein
MCIAARKRILSACQERTGTPGHPGSGNDAAREEIVMHGVIETAEYRRQDLLADAARYRLVRTATSGVDSTKRSISLTAVARTVQAVATGTVALITSLLLSPDRVSAGWRPAAGGR